MAITFDEVSLDLHEPDAPRPGAGAAPATPAPTGGPDIEQRLEQLLRLRDERALRLLAD